MDTAHFLGFTVGLKGKLTDYFYCIGSIVDQIYPILSIFGIETIQLH